MTPPAYTVLFVHPSDELYGSDRCLLDLVRRLPEHARAIVALPADLAYEGRLSHELRAAGATVMRVDYVVLRRMWLRPRYLPGLLRRATVGSLALARVIRRERADVVYVNTVAAVGGALAAFAARRRCIWHVHEVLTDEPAAFRMTLRLLLRAFATRIIANSHATARSIVAGDGRRAERTSVIYPGIDPGDLPPTRTASDGRPLRLAIVGRIAPRKGIEEGLAAVGILRRRGIDLRLEVLGSPPPGREQLRDAMHRQAMTAGIDAVTTFAGFVDDVPARLRRADILIVPSQRPEPFGMVLLEGMAAGCAVVATRNGGGSDEILDDGVTGLYCGCEPASIAAAVERLARDEPLRHAIARRAPHAVHERFTTERYAQAIIVQLERVVAGQGSSA
jgi:glycosyltransferase involved in cell wall biosynthesis